MRDMNGCNKDAALELAAFTGEASGRILPVELDVTDEAACNAAAAKIEADPRIAATESWGALQSETCATVRLSRFTEVCSRMQNAKRMHAGNLKGSNQ